MLKIRDSGKPYLFPPLLSHSRVTSLICPGILKCLFCAVWIMDS